MLFYLYKKRIKYKLFSYMWVKFWAKRVMTFPRLLGIEFIILFYAAKRAKIGNMTIIEGFPFDGDCKNVVVGSNVFIAKSAKIATHDLIKIGNSVVINSDVMIFTASHDVADENWKTVSKPVVIEDYVWIASRAIIMPGVVLGKGSVVGAGSVVTKNIEPYSIVVGNPAVVLKKTRNKYLNYSPVKFAAPVEAWIGK